MKNKALRFIIAVIAVMMSALPAKADERVDILGRAPQPIGGQFWYQALDDNNSFGALRVGTAF